MKKLDFALTLLKEKFDVLLVAGLFTTVFLFYVLNTFPDREAALHELWQGLLFALLALLGLRPRPPAVGSASTESGDVLIQPTPADPATKEKQNENIEP